MNPFFFGTSDKQLFGVHHPPERDEVRDGAVLLCPSFGHEYIAAHGSMQHLASSLARNGFHALRFDYFGTGDSAGDIDAASLDQWLDDVETAIQELVDTSGSRRVCVVGLRLGGLIAALATQRATGAMKRSIGSLAMWDPVWKGGEFLDWTADLQESWMGAMYVRAPRHLLHTEGPELMGFVLPQALQAELREADLSATAGPGVPCLVVDGQESAFAESSAVAEHWRAQGAQVDCEHIETPAAWVGEHWQTIALPPVELTRRIGDWIQGVYQ